MTAGIVPTAVSEAIRIIGHQSAPVALEAANGGQKQIERLKPHPQAVPLISILESAPVQDAFSRYNENDRAANVAQRRYKNARVAIFIPVAVALAIGLLAVMVPAGTIGSVVANTVGLEEQDAEGFARLLPIWLIYLGLGLTALLTLTLRPTRNYVRWKEARGTAEGLRGELFERVMQGGSDLPSTVPEGVSPLLLKFEYFRRYQVEAQAAYHATRGRQHEKNARVAAILQTTLIWLLLIWALLCFLTSLSGFSEQGSINGPAVLSAYATRASGVLQNIEIFDADFLSLSISLALAVCYGVILLYVFLSSSVRNAARYKIMRENFTKLQQELGDVRSAAAVGDASAVESYVARVHSVMSTELADWVRLQDLDRGKGCNTLTIPSASQLNT